MGRLTEIDKKQKSKRSSRRHTIGVKQLIFVSFYIHYFANKWTYLFLPACFLGATECYSFL